MHTTQTHWAWQVKGFGFRTTSAPQVPLPCRHGRFKLIFLGVLWILVTLFFQAQKEGVISRQHRWQRIQSTLKQTKIRNAVNLVKVMKSYNTDLGEIDVKYEFGIDGLLVYFDEMMGDTRRRFFQETLQNIINLALELPEICTKPIRLLRKQVVVECISM